MRSRRAPAIAIILASAVTVFIATPAAQQQYGLYAVQIVYSAPTVTLTASPSTVTTGATTTLTWMTANATACTAGGGSFIGSQATGSHSTAVAVSATTTFASGNAVDLGAGTDPSSDVGSLPSPESPGGATSETTGTPLIHPRPGRDSGIG